MLTEDVAPCLANWASNSKTFPAWIMAARINYGEQLHEWFAANKHNYKFICEKLKNDVVSAEWRRSTIYYRTNSAKTLNIIIKQTQVKNKVNSENGGEIATVLLLKKWCVIFAARRVYPAINFVYLWSAISVWKWGHLGSLGRIIVKRISNWHLWIRRRLVLKYDITGMRFAFGKKPSFKWNLSNIWSTNPQRPVIKRFIWAYVLFASISSIWRNRHIRASELTQRMIRLPTNVLKL
jgi:hypothetical protein